MELISIPWLQKGTICTHQGPGQVRLLAQQAAAAIPAGKTITMAVKTATLKQLSAIMGFACAKGGFPTLNRHVTLEDLSGLGWLQVLLAQA